MSGDSGARHFVMGLVDRLIQRGLPHRRIPLFIRFLAAAVPLPQPPAIEEINDTIKDYWGERFLIDDEILQLTRLCIMAISLEIPEYLNVNGRPERPRSPFPGHSTELESEKERGHAGHGLDE